MATACAPFVPYGGRMAFVPGYHIGFIAFDFPVQADRFLLALYALTQAHGHVILVIGIDSNRYL